jgi:agmatinase
MRLIYYACLALLQGTATALLAPHRDQAILNPQGDDLDLTDSGYYFGISTFAHTKYVNCFSDAEINDSRYDIAIIGAPHDTVRADPS